MRISKQLLLPAVIFAVAFAGCIGQVGTPPSPNEKVASLTLGSDALQQLSAGECTDASMCTLPNNRDCVQLVIDVFGDGHTVGYCTQPDGKVLKLTNPRDIPMVCRSNKDRYSVQCMDIRDNLAVDVTDLDVHIYPSRSSSAYKRFIGTGIGEGAGYLVEDGEGEGLGEGEPTNPQDDLKPPQDDNPACTQHAKAWFLKAFNDILKKEGLNFQYTPTGGDSTSGFFDNSQFQSNPSDLCKQNSQPQCDGKGLQQGRCFCWNGQFGATCKGAPMVDAALSVACNMRPPTCNDDSYATAIWDESRNAINWIQNNNNTTTTQEGVATAGAITAGALAAAAGIGALIMLADPLVLDLEGDGVELTSAKDGVTFDMSGTGATRMAWVKGKDDALLAIDRNGNGKIDNGSELFSDAFQAGGLRATDGFHALAIADSPVNYGNGNGKVDAGDAMFDQLRLWQDANGDGVSQDGELRTLSSVGIEALNVKSHNRALVDSHGNDLSTQGSFVRQGKTLSMLDALLVNR